MAGLRKKDGSGELEFPNLKLSDVLVWHENFHKLHPEVKRWHARIHRQIRQRGYVHVPFLNQRKRYFPFGLSKKNAGPNMEIQGAGASIADKGLLAFAQVMPFYSLSDWTGIMLQVHDCIGAQCPDAHVKKKLKELEEAMAYEINGVKIIAEGVAVDRWSREK